MPAFLFTDIEGSTRLWEEHPDTMAEALARHDTLLNEAVTRGGGTVLKTTGDGLIAVFDTSADAVAVTLDAQRALGGEEWGATGPLRVRMGIHAGETESRDGDYFGPVINRAARIMASGHGGQVLLSATSADQVWGRLPDGATLRDLGTHRLKDLTLPEHLYQLAHPDLKAEFPALRTLETRAHNLPLQATEFLGREHELEAIEVMLDSPSTRLLTITGPGGAGKTRLGLQVAAELADRYDDGVFFVDLSAERDSGAAFEAVVRALDLPSSGGDPLQTLETRLADSEILLVLDNFEQVTSAAPGLSALLQKAPRLKVIVTSRETLRIRAEKVFPVPPLSLPHPSAGLDDIAGSEAVQLFVDRARAVTPDFTLDAGNARVIAEICLRLDGLPLAIELAAARLNVFAPTELLERLRQRLDVLGAGGRDLPDRQRTLWGAIGWSYELLADDERVLFELFSVFSGARLADLESVAVETLGARDVIEPLSSLVDKSLIRRGEEEGRQRFSMLLMIKEYAQERLAASADLDREIRQAHAVHYSAYATDLRVRLRGPDRQSALEELSIEIGNLRSAWRFWVARGDVERLFELIDALWALHEAKGWYHAAIELATDALGVLATSERASALVAEELALRTSLARALMAVRGYGVEVEQAFEEILARVDAEAPAEQRFPVLRALASYYVNIADFTRALDVGRDLDRLATQTGDRSIGLEAEYVIGASTAFSGDLIAGLAHLDAVIDRYDPKVHGANRYRLGPNTAVVARVAAGLVRWQCGSLERGVESVADALAVARALEHPYSLAYALYHNGFLAFSRGRAAECGELADELATVSAANDYLLWSTLAKVLKGVSLVGSGRVDEGIEMTETGVELYQGLTTPPVFWPLILGLRAAVHGIGGRAERALSLIEEAIALSNADDAMTQDFLVVRGDVLRMLPGPDLARAEESYVSAADHSRSAGTLLVELRALTRLVALRREMRRSPDGGDELRDVYDRFTEGLDEPDLVAARSLLD